MTPNKKKIHTLTCLKIVQQILLFFEDKKTPTQPILGPTRLLISEIFPSKPDFHDEKKSFLHGLVKTYTFINFWEIYHLSTQLNGHTRLFGRLEYALSFIWLHWNNYISAFGIDLLDLSVFFQGQILPKLGFLFLIFSVFWRILVFLSRSVFLFWC
jgi:hypothetical protein